MRISDWSSDVCSSDLKSIVAVAEGAGLSSVALVTDMNQPLGQAAGNALEVAECIELLTGGTGDRRFCEVTLALAEEMLLLGGFAGEAAVARADRKSTRLNSSH